MENDNLGSKKMNNKQNPAADLNPENLPNKKDDTAKRLVPEVETDASGNQKIVHRARNVDADSEQNNSENVISNSEITSKQQTQKMVENKDHNSDTTAHRYPNSDPDNHKDRGNIKLDE